MDGGGGGGDHPVTTARSFRGAFAPFFHAANNERVRRVSLRQNTAIVAHKSQLNATWPTNIAHVRK